MGKIIFKKYRIPIIALLAIAFILVPNFSANACILSRSPISNCIQEGATYILFLVFSVVGQIIAALTKGLYYVINIPVYPAGGIAVVDESWKIMRNFANMFFIVALIMMAFATIFNISQYDARTLFPKFLISALLINFSLVLGTLVVDIAQILSNVFLAAIGDMSSRLGESFVQGLNQTLPAKSDISTLAGGGNIEQAVFGSLVQLIFSVILFFTFLFSLLTAFIFALIRIPILWALLVVSPLIWILNVFPAGQNLYKKWWSTFIGWNMFLPIFLFFLYFGLYFLQNQGAVMGAIAQQTKDQNILGFATFQTIFYYVLASIFLIGGTMTALKASMFGGAGVVGVARWSSGVAARRIGLTGANQAWQEKKAQIQGGEGRLGKLFGGPPPGLGAARNVLGVRGAEFKTQKDFVDRAGKEFETFQNQYNVGKLSLDEIVAKAKSSRATDPSGFAYAKMAAKLGRLDAPLMKKTLEGLSGNALAAQDFIKTAKESKFSNMKGGELLEIAMAEGAFSSLDKQGNLLPARKELLKYIQADARIAGSMDEARFRKAISLLGDHTTTDGKEFMKEMGKVSPDFVMNYNLNNPAFPDLRAGAEAGFNTAHGAPAANDFQLRTQILGGSLKTGDVKNTAGLHTRVWETPEFKESMKLYISQLRGRGRTNFVSRLEKALLDSAGGDRKNEILYNDILGAGYGAAPARARIPPIAATPVL